MLRQQNGQQNFWSDLIDLMPDALDIDTSTWTRLRASTVNSGLAKGGREASVVCMIVPTVVGVFRNLGSC